MTALISGGPWAVLAGQGAMLAAYPPWPGLLATLANDRLYVFY
jgi:hypothetical protein